MGQTKFEPRRYYQSGQSYRPLPFRFMQFDSDRKLVVNEVGEHLLVDNASFDAFVQGPLDPTSEGYHDLKAKHVLFDSESILPFELLATKYRTKKSFLAGFTKLHIFVVTLRCEHSCHYCQVSRVSADRSKYDMSEETADRALDCIFRTSADDIKIEFQGGEPLLNFPLLQYVVD